MLRFSGFTDEWKSFKLKDLLHNKSSSISINQLEDNVGNYPLYGASGFLKCIDFYEMDSDYISIVKDGSGVGNISFHEKNTSVVNTSEYILPKENLNIHFIFYLLQTINLDKYKTGSTIPHIYFKDYSIEKVKIPKYDEQKKIGILLKNLDAKIEILDNKLQMCQNFKKYLMQQIFTQKLRFGKTSEWETFALNDIGKTYNGLSGLSKDNFEKGNSKYITYKSIFDNNILKSDFTENVDLNNKSQNEVKKGDLFFTGSSETPEEVGMVSVLSSTVEDCYLNSFCFGFRLNNNYDVNPLFLAYYLRSPIMRNKIMILAQGSTRFNLSKKEILKLKVEIPSISEQQQIIDLFQNVDNKINEISIQTDNFNKFKKGLLQQMFV